MNRLLLIEYLLLQITLSMSGYYVNGHSEYLGQWCAENIDVGGTRQRRYFWQHFATLWKNIPNQFLFTECKWGNAWTLCYNTELTNSMEQSLYSEANSHSAS
jgi:hypothetical protein